MRASEAGFSLIELLLATALFAVVAFGAFEAVRQAGTNVRQLTARHLASAALERLSARLRAEARSATAIWVGAPGAAPAPDGCVQLDFFTADAAGPRFWSYRSAGGTLQRLAGTSPIADCAASLHGDTVLDGLREPPTATVVGADALAGHRDAYLGEPDSPFVGAGVPAIAPIPLGISDGAGHAVSGGNAVVEFRLETADGARVIDLLAGTFPNGFTEVLRYTCSERCDVGHDTPAAKTLTACAMSWQPGWSTYVRWGDYATNPDGTLAFPAGWFIAGTFVFTYSGTRASDGGLDTLVKPYAATNWDAARDYAAFPPDRAAADGSRAGSFAPWDVRSEAAPSWFADFAPYLAAGQREPIAAEQRRCDAVQQQGAAGGFYANG